MSKEDSNKPDDGGCGDYCFCIRKPEEEDKFKVSENRLQNWEKWMKRRSQIHDKISRPLGRPVEELVMNVGDEYRNIQEDKEIFYYTKLETHFDKFRGNPEFWKLPTGLVNKCEDFRDPIYFTVKTKFEKNQIPTIEYVRNANYILNEKNVLSHTRKLYNLWRKSAYRNEQLKILSSKVNLIEPHKPECDELIIVGQKISSTKKKDIIRLPKQSLQALRYSEAFSIQTNSFTVHEIPRLCFAINGIILAHDDRLVNNTEKIRVLFECAENLKVPVVEHLKFENKGLTTLRFYWNRIEKFRLFRNLTQNDREECQEFYFNKNELLLVPGKTLLFPIWFKAKKVGNYIQFWKITTLPKLWDDDFQLIVQLQGIVRIVGFEEKSRNMKQMLEVRARSTLIKDLLRSMLENLKYTNTELVTFVFSEKQIFESVNQEIWWGVEKRSKYLYDKDIVNELKQFYQEVKQPNFPTNWNYSIRDLKIMTRKKDISDYVENETEQAKKARNRRIELNEEPKIEVQVPPKKPAGPKEKPSPKDKAAAPPPAPVEEEEDIFSIKETRYNKLENILHRLERPLMIENRDREKYFTVYIIMRTYLFKMCDALETFDNYSNYSIGDVDYRPTYQYSKVTSFDDVPERLIFERFDEIWLDGTKLIEPDTKIVDPVFPKPEILKNIPQDDAKMIYHTYFGIPIIDTTKKKGGKEDKKKAKEEKKTKDKKGKGDADKQKKKEEIKVVVPPRVSTVKEGFDPYAEEYIPPETESTEDLESLSKYYVTKTEYNYGKYLIVYTHLTEAIEAMVDALETFNDIIVSPETLCELKKCTSIYPEEDMPTDTKEEEEEEKEEVLNIEGSKANVPTENSEEDNLYFKYLLDSHLNKNINTKKYIIHGRTQPRDDPDLISIVSESTEKPDSRVNVFRSHETIIESVYPSGSVSVAVQMSDVDEEYEQFSNVLLTQSETTESDDTKNTVGEILSHDMFYFMDDSDEETVEEESKKSDE